MSMFSKPTTKATHPEHASEKKARATVEPREVIVLSGEIPEAALLERIENTPPPEPEVETKHARK